MESNRLEMRRPVMFELRNDEFQRGYFHGFFQSIKVIDSLKISEPIVMVETIEGEVKTVSINNFFFLDQQNWYNKISELEETSPSMGTPPTPEKVFDDKVKE